MTPCKTGYRPMQRDVLSVPTGYDVIDQHRKQQ